MSRGVLAAPGDPYRWGVYLRPDPVTCSCVTALTGQLRAQYGIVSAGAFPPHATLIGSQHIDAPAAAIVEAVTSAVKGRSAFDVHNAGIIAMGSGWVYDVHHNTDGTPNEDFVELAAAVDDAVSPLVTAAPNPEPHVFDRAKWRAHLSLASHDLLARPDLRAEVGEYLQALPPTPPKTFKADKVTLYRTSSADWSGRWWETLQWTHTHTWHLPS